MEQNAPGSDDPQRGRLAKELFALAMLTAFVLGLLVTVAPRLISAGGETVYLGLVGPMSGPDADLGQAMVAGASLMVERANASGELGQRRLELVIRDDKNDPETAKAQAVSLAEETDVLAVLGHLTDATSAVAGPIYKQHELAAVSGSGGIPDITVNNDWYFRVGLTTVLQGTFVADYMARVLDQEKLILIYEDNAYGRTMMVAIEDELSLRKRLGQSRMVLQQKTSFDPKSPDAEKVIEKIVVKLSESYSGEMIFVAAQEATASTLLRQIQDNPRLRFGKPIPYKIMGPESFAKPSLTAALSNLRREKAQPGIYSEGVYAVAPFLEDIANQRALDFRVQYKTRNGRPAGVIAAGFHDAAAVVVDALRGLPNDLSDIKAARREVRGHLGGLDSPDKAVSGVTGGLSFDRDGNAVKPVPIGVYHTRRLVSPPVQLSAVSSLETTNTNDVLQIYGNYFTRTNIVHAGLQINQISDIDLDDHRFTADFNLWFRYHNKLDLSAIEFPNAAEPIDLGPPVEKFSEGTAFYSLHRIKGIFKTDFQPQTGSSRERLLGIQVRHRILNFERLILVPDALGMKSHETGTLTERIERKILFGETTNWAVDKAQMYLDTEPIATRGNPRFGGKQVEGYSRFNLGIWIKPTDLALRGLVDLDLAMRIFLLLGAAVSLLALAACRPRFAPFVKWFWLPHSVALLIMLFCAEAVGIDWLSRYINTPAYIEFVVTVFRVLWWFVPAWMFNRGVEHFFWAPLEQRTGREVPPVVRTFFAGLVFIMALLGVTAFVFDQKITSLLATSGVLAMIFGLALQMNLSNVFSGIAINMERPFRIGDWIRVSGFEPGKVISITWRTTRIETFDHSVVCIPNSVASDSTVENLSYPLETYRSELIVHIDPGAKPRWVEKILFDAVISAKGTLKHPTPLILFQGVKQWSAEYSVRFFCQDYRHSIDVDAAVWNDIVQNLRYAGFKSIVHAEFTLFHLDDEEGETRDVAALLVNDIDVFEPFGPLEKERICKMLRHRHLEPERTIIEQGDDGDSLFLVAEGALMVEMTLEDDTTVEVGRLGAGDFFGEMALLTGEPRGATVTTITPSQVLEITKEDFATIIHEFPEIADDLSKILTRRTLENLRIQNAHFASLAEEKSLARNILAKIGRFFDLSLGGSGKASAAE